MKTTECPFCESKELEYRGEGDYFCWKCKVMFNENFVELGKAIAEFADHIYVIKESADDQERTM